MIFAKKVINMFYKDKFRDERKKKKLSQELLGKLLGKNRMTINKWEKGKCVPYESDIRMAAQHLQIDVSEISDLDEVNCSNLKINPSLATPSTVTSFVEKIESSLSIQDRIFLDGINAELYALRDKVYRIEQESSPSEAIADEINSFIYKKEVNGRFTYINRSYRRYLNTENNMILGRNNREIFGWQESEFLDELESKAIKGASIHNMEIVIPGSLKQKNGLFSAFPVYGVNGILQEVIFKIDDVTDSIEVFDKYKTLEKVIHSSNEILWIKKSDETYSFIGAPIYSISGYYVNEFLKKPHFWLANIVDEYDRDKVGMFYRTYESGESINYKIKTKNNNIKFVKEKIFRQDKLTFGIIQDVTGELKAQEDKQLLLDIINEMPEVTWVEDNYGKNVRILSSSIHKLVGGGALESLKAHPEAFINYVREEDVEKYKKWVMEIEQDKWWKNETKKAMCEKIQFRVLLKDGKVKWIEETVYSTLKFKKQGIRFGMFKDITKEREQQLEMQYLFKCVNDMDSMCWVAELTKNDRLKYIAISDGVKNIYGEPKTQFAKMNKTLKDVSHLDNKDEGDAYKSVKDIVFPYNCEYKISISGKTKWLQERIYKKENLIFGLTTDITDRKLKDNKIEILANTMNNLDSCILITTNEKSTENNDTFRMLFVSDGFEKIFSVPKQCIIDDPHYLRSVIHPSDRESVNELWEKVCDPGLNEEISLQYKIITADGTIKLVNDSAKPIGSINDKFIRFGMISDITNQRNKRN
jgi:PAS domain-containing protein